MGLIYCRMQLPKPNLQVLQENAPSSSLLLSLLSLPSRLRWMWSHCLILPNCFVLEVVYLGKVDSVYHQANRHSFAEQAQVDQASQLHLALRAIYDRLIVQVCKCLIRCTTVKGRTY